MGIGGLVSSNTVKNSSKVPLLGDIPLIGQLFQSKNRDQSKTNLIIFVTAKTVSPDGADVSEVFDPRQTREMELRRSELPGYRDGSDPFISDGAKGSK
jgi:type IV pilus assembly protein PilQ